MLIALVGGAVGWSVAGLGVGSLLAMGAQQFGPRLRQIFRLDGARYSRSRC